MVEPSLSLNELLEKEIRKLSISMRQLHDQWVKVQIFEGPGTSEQWGRLILDEDEASPLFTLYKSMY